MHLRLHRAHPDVPREESRPSSSVHVLNGEEDLRAALHRAAAFDQRAAEALRSRSARYQALLGEAGAADDAPTPLSRPA